MFRTIHTCKQQWQIQVEDDGSYRIVNPAPDGTLQYFQAESGQYGEPIIRPEPDLAVACPSGCTYVDASGQEITPDQLISGIVCKDANGDVAQRLSLTNAKNKAIAWSLSDDGVLEIDGNKYHLYALVIKDKNRFRNYDAFFAPEKPDAVRVIELENLI